MSKQEATRIRQITSLLEILTWCLYAVERYDGDGLVQNCKWAIEKQAQGISVLPKNTSLTTLALSDFTTQSITMIGLPFGQKSLSLQEKKHNLEYALQCKADVIEFIPCHAAFVDGRIASFQEQLSQVIRLMYDKVQQETILRFVFDWSTIMRVTDFQEKLGLVCRQKKLTEIVILSDFRNPITSDDISRLCNALPGVKVKVVEMNMTYSRATELYVAGADLLGTDSVEGIYQEE